MKKFLATSVAILATAAHGYVKNNFESVPPNENKLIEGMAAETAKQVKRHRDAHAKAHGCVDEVKFEVRRDLPKEYRVGIFEEPGREYDGMLRLSNGSGDVGVSDVLGGGQGMALKLFITDEKQLAKLHKINGDTRFLQVDPKTYLTQDFLGINFREFFVKDAADYLVFFAAKGKAAAAAAKAQAEGKSPAEVGAIAQGVFAKEFLLNEDGKTLKRPREAAVLKGLETKTLNPLVEDYHSMVPSLFGADRAVKYRMHPCNDKAKAEYKVPEGIDVDKDPNFLKKTLEASLRSEDLCYKLSAEFHTKDMPSVEDAVARWSENPVWVELGTFRVKKKAKERELTCDDICENPSFSPWRTLVEHQPIGGIQRVRERVYAEVHKARHENRGHKKAD